MTRGVTPSPGGSPRPPDLRREERGAARDAVSRRADLEARWLDLTRRILPAMAVDHDWPISLDHCFMRVCLDEAVGAPWTRTVRRPAIRHLTEAQVTAAVRVAEAIVAGPETLAALNRKSLRGRRTAASNGQIA